jgi:hypothetical protein
MSDDYLVTTAELADSGLTSQDVRPLCPHAVEYTSLDGSSCWLREDLVELLHAPARRDEP